VALWLTSRVDAGESRHRQLEAFILGGLLGYLTLVKVVLAPFPLVIAAVLVGREWRLSIMWKQWLRTMTLVSVGYMVLVGPWMARNYLVTHGGKADAEFALLNAPYGSELYKNLLKPAVFHWQISFEEPFIWDRPYEPPSVARYLYPGEAQETADAFTKLGAKHGIVDAEIESQFANITAKRRATSLLHTSVLPVLTRALRIWITPRLSAFGVETGRLHGMKKILGLGLALMFNAPLALLAFAGGALCFGSRRARLLLLAIAYFTIVHPLLGTSQSRYTVPVIPAATVLAAMACMKSFDFLKRRRLGKFGGVAV
jgi:hypothetical protein